MGGAARPGRCAGTLYTVGHSNHSVVEFISLLLSYGITAVADVRSRPYSKFHPQFNQKILASELESSGIRYVFMGRELGGRPADLGLSVGGGAASFEVIATTEAFKRGIERLSAGRWDHKIAIMCAEKDPLDCHRTVLVCRRLREMGVPVVHILADGGSEAHAETESRLLEMSGLQNSLFSIGLTEDCLLSEAYSERARAIAMKSKG